MRQWSGPAKHKTRRLEIVRRFKFLIDERFQWRYTTYLVTTVIIGTLFTGGVTAYFLNQNYGIFTKLAYQHAPDLLPQLEREQIWINTFLVAFFVTLVSFNFFYGLRMTFRIAGPMVMLRRHIRNISRGVFGNPTLRVRETDEFGDLVDDYNYLYQSLQAQIRRDIQLLTASLDHADINKVRTHLIEILDEKKAQLDSSDKSRMTSASSLFSAPTPSSRRVS